MNEKVVKAIRALMLVASAAFGGFATSQVAEHPAGADQKAPIVNAIISAMSLLGFGALSTEAVSGWLTGANNAAHRWFDDSTLPPAMQLDANVVWASRKLDPEAAAATWVKVWTRAIAAEAAEVKPNA